MSALATTPVTFSLKRQLSLSVLMHAVLLGLLIVSGFYSHRGDLWGGPGGSITVGVVGSVPGIPMPRPDVETPSRVVDESKGLYKSEPPPEIKQTPPDAVPIPKFMQKKPPKYVSRPSKILENPTVPPPNAVPYGGGGTPTVPYTSFAMGAGTSTQGGLAFGSSGGGDFASRFSGYVDAVQRRISSNWLQYTVDPNVSVAPRVTISFDILRDGTVTNVQTIRSSGNSSVDRSAVRAVLESTPLLALPPAYSGSKVSVEFWFDFHR
ncbi:MAG: TonB family protein [Candidatus Acidiferrales bacterium]